MIINPFNLPDFNSQYHDTISVTLGELIEGKFFDWANEMFNWSDYAYSPEQYNRVCNAFIDRYYFREIAIIPPYRWAKKLMYKIKYELCPKYNRAYKAMDGADILQISDKYGKSRDINSTYPETLLSGNSDYLESGSDHEHEDIELGNVMDIVPDYVQNWRDLDAAFLDELDTMFTCLITVNIND